MASNSSARRRGQGLEDVPRADPAALGAAAAPPPSAELGDVGGGSRRRGGIELLEFGAEGEDGEEWRV